MNRPNLLTLAILILLPTLGFSQLTISGDLRPRAEYRHGFKTLASPDQDAAAFIDQRSRLNVGFKQGPNEYFFTLQDVRVWGNQPQLVVNQGASTGIHQAWARIGLGKNLSMKLGRQEIDYDDSRIFGNVDWAQQARSHDAGLLIYQDSAWVVHAGFAFNQSSAGLVGTDYALKNYKTFQYLWYHRDWTNLNLSFLFLNLGTQANFANGVYQTNFAQTVGGRLGYKKNKVKAHLAYYAQFGTHNDTLETPVAANYLAFDISYQLNKNFNLLGGLELISGNDDADNNGTNNAFNPYFGTNHKFNGHMDYFYVGNHLNQVGLYDYFLTLSYKHKRFGAKLMPHLFYAGGSVADAASPGSYMDSRLGTEIDLMCTFKVNEGAMLKFGYSQMFATSTMEALKGGSADETNNWAWAMIAIRPSHTFNLK